MSFYKLDENKNVIEITHREFMDNAVAGNFPVIPVGKWKHDNIMLSTVFVPFGLQPWDDDDGPVCFETCIFIENDSHVLHRYKTWNDAENMHNKIVQDILSGWLPTFED